MNRSRTLTARSAVLAASAAATALALAGCGGGSSGATGATGGSNSAGTGAKASSSDSTAQNKSATTTAASYYPLGVGNTWVYTMNGFGGKGTVTQKMISITPSSAGQVVTVDATNTYPEKKTTKETLIFQPDGSIQMPISQFLSGMSVTIEKGQVLWPSSAQLASGQPYHTTIVMKIDESGMDETVTMPITVKAEGTASVTVPSGTYQASVIDETMSTSIDKYKVSVAVRTWVANGVGPVKSEVTSGLFSGSGSPSSVEELESFTKG